MNEQNEQPTREELIEIIRAALDRTDITYIMLHAAAAMLK